LLSPTAAKMEADTRSVVVQNVHFMANEHVLAAHFITIGQFKRVTIVKDKITKSPKVRTPAHLLPHIHNTHTHTHTL
jgi:hypothetical protein